VIERKALLKRFLAGQPKGSPVRHSDHVQGQGPEFFAQACKHHLEGIVSKLATSPYRSGRSDAWLKVKCLSRQEFVIGGWMASDKPGRALRSVLLGYYEGGKLIFAGKAGTGFGLTAGRELAERLGKNRARHAALRLGPAGLPPRRPLGRPAPGGGGNLHHLDRGPPPASPVLRGVAGGQERAGGEVRAAKPQRKLTMDDISPS